MRNLKLVSPQSHQEGSGQPNRCVVKEAARALVRLRVRQGKGPHKFTGKLFGEPATVGVCVVLPDGSPGWIKQVQRGYCCVRTDQKDPDEGFYVHVYVPATALRPRKLQEAMLLGSLKHGVREKKSVVKAISSRINGSMPVKNGSRPRGRPSKSENCGQLDDASTTGGMTKPPGRDRLGLGAAL